MLGAKIINVNKAHVRDLYGDNMNKKKYTSTLILLSAAIIWGFAFAAQDAASDMGAFTLGFARSIIAGIFLIGVVIISDRMTGSERSSRLCD